LNAESRAFTAETLRNVNLTPTLALTPTPTLILILTPSLSLSLSLSLTPTLTLTLSLSLTLSRVGPHRLGWGWLATPYLLVRLKCILSISLSTLNSTSDLLHGWGACGVCAWARRGEGTGERYKGRYSPSVCVFVCFRGVSA